MKTEVVKQFIAKSKSVKPNNIIPALSCIKAECIGNSLVLTKSSLDTWLIESTPVTKPFKGVILFEEKPLAAYLSISKDEEISFTINGSKVALVSGSNTIEFTMLDVKEYPKTPEIEDEQPLYVFNQMEADAFRMACAFVKKDAAGHPLENIFVVDGFIYASDGFYGLLYPTGAPDMAISPQCAAVVQDGSMYMKSGNYTCIVSPDGSTRHLFVSSEAEVAASEQKDAEGRAEDLQDELDDFIEVDLVLDTLQYKFEKGNLQIVQKFEQFLERELNTVPHAEIFK